MPELADIPLGELLDRLASTGDTPAAGVASALTCGLAASLLELTAALAQGRLGGEDAAEGRRMGEIAERAGQLRRRLPTVADQDIVAYSEVAAAPAGAERSAALERASGPPREVASSAAEVSRLAAEVAGAGDWPFTPDAKAAGRLADAAASAAASLVAANQGGA
jgi:formiminotetrahydrofolate cyclodeaminase